MVNFWGAVFLKRSLFMAPICTTSPFPDVVFKFKTGK